MDLPGDDSPHAQTLGTNTDVEAFHTASKTYPVGASGNSRSHAEICSLGVKRRSQAALPLLGVEEGSGGR